ncbi:hypothetical protein D9M70_500610 [compost metagenome]
MASGASVSVQLPSGCRSTVGRTARLSAKVTAPLAGTCRCSERWEAKLRSTASSHARSASPSTSNASCTTPPQHWPSAGPSGMRSMRRCSCRTSISRAISMPRHSRCPPPMVPTRSFGLTSMRMPGSRGAEPLTSTMVTIATGTPVRTMRAASAKRKGLSGASCMSGPYGNTGMPGLAWGRVGARLLRPPAPCLSGQARGESPGHPRARASLLSVRQLVLPLRVPLPRRRGSPRWWRAPSAAG